MSVGDVMLVEQMFIALAVTVIVIAFIGRIIAFVGTVFDLSIAGFPLQRLYEFRWGYLLRLSSWWIGIHWSGYNRRLCINLLPCVTVWLVLPGGKTPHVQ